ncbi:hypothetical protein BA177_16510 [Woeseia oceani]|uniref:Uncharacterized protein n=1 Tax=Woeseia oceani TaxID=1548547 RepID=A0A193LJG3_9GAMM|nr:hypothetical protein BA177_16510 [Woeseia oceani]
MRVLRCFTQWQLDSIKSVCHRLIPKEHQLASIRGIQRNFRIFRAPYTECHQIYRAIKLRIQLKNALVRVTGWPGAG